MNKDLQELRERFAKFWVNNQMPEAVFDFWLKIIEERYVAKSEVEFEVNCCRWEPEKTKGFKKEALVRLHNKDLDYILSRFLPDKPIER